MKKQRVMENRSKKIKNSFEGQVNITIHDVEELFPDLERSSIYWMLSKLTSSGKIQRVRSGVYSLNRVKDRTIAYLSDIAKKASDLLDEEGYDYYISGIDIILKFMQHVPEQYPVIIFIEKKAESDIFHLLNNEFKIIKANVVKTMDDDYVYSIMQPDIVVYLTDNFDYTKKNQAVIEKAFIDLFYAITRNYYPMPLQELGRTYSNMVRLGAIDQGKMITMSYKRNLQFDIRYIVEDRKISDGAKKIVKYI